jgi:hypothetical protein
VKGSRVPHQEGIEGEKAPLYRRNRPRQNYHYLALCVYISLMKDGAGDVRG